MRTAVPKSAAAAQPRITGTETGTAISPLAHLQRAAGNQAVMRAMSGGAPLPRELRSSLESYFKTPLDRVRVHNDESSQSFADSLGARAFTVGQDIHLGSDGARATGSDRNQLIAHPDRTPARTASSTRATSRANSLARVNSSWGLTPT